jgi:hypothetical protein
MRTHHFYLILLALIFSGGCQHTTPPSTDEFQSATGTVKWKSALHLYFIKIDVPVQNITEFYPENMADDFKQDSLRVRFSGKLIIPPDDPPAPYASVNLSFIEAINK